MSDATDILGLARAAHLLAPGEGVEALAQPHRALIEGVAALRPAADVTEGLLREDVLRARLAVWLGLVEWTAATRSLREQVARLASGSLARVGDLLVQEGQLTLSQAARVEQCLSALPSLCPRCRGAIDRFLGAMAPAYACPACGAAIPSPLAGAQPGSSATVIPATTPTPGSKEEPTVAYERGVVLPMPGRTFGRYRIVSELGRGGMGIVYKAVQTEIDRVVALKTLLAGPNAPEATVKRFLREAASCAHLSHPNIVMIHDVGTEGGIHYFTMQHVEGKTLSQVLKERKRLPLEEACRLLTDVARAVHYAHGKGVIHRDLKPSNILIDDAGHPHVMDFGLAKQVEGPTDLTLTGTTIGTPSYMSPEQAGGGKGEVDSRSDVYSLGAILYECLAGQKVFTGDSDVQVIFKVVFEAPKPLCEVAPDLPREVETVVMRSIEKDRERRYASAWEFASALEAFRPRPAMEALPEGTTVVRRRRAPWGAVVALLLFASAGAAWKWWPHTPTGPPAPVRDSSKARSLLDRAALRPPADAIGLLTEAIACDPDLAEAHYARARAYQAIGKNEEALADYGKAIALNDSYLQARLYRALLVDRALGKPGEAKKDYDKILELDPGSEVGHLVTGISLYQQGKRAKALPYLQKAVSLNARDESALYYLIWCYLQTAEYLKAEEISTKAIALYPANEVYLNLRGLSFYYREMWKESQRDYEASLAANGRNADSWNNLGLLWQDRGDVAKAHECFTTAIGLSPNGALYVKNRAELLMREERAEEAQPDIEKALALAPADFEAHLVAGQVQMGLGKSKEAIKEFNEAIRLNPRSGAAYWNLATAYAVKMDIQSVMFAIKNLERGMLVDPRDSRTRTMFEFSQWLKSSGFQLLMTPTDGGTPRQKAVAKLRSELPKLIDRLSRSRLPAQAVQYVDTVIGMDPEFADAYLIRGICWALAHEYDRAIPDLEKAVSLNEKMHPARGMIANVALEKRDRAGAIATYDGILALEGAPPFYRFLRGVARLDEGDKKGAIEDFTALREITPDWPTGVLDEWIAEASE